MAGRDIRGKIAARLAESYHNLITIYYSIQSHFLIWYWRVDMGNNCKFIGHVRFFRAPGASIKVGDSCRFRSAVWSNYAGINRDCSISVIKSTANINIGTGCGFTSTVIASANTIVLGDNVLCGANVTIIDTDFHGISVDSRNQSGDSAPVIIEDNVWLGLNVTVLKGSVIGKNSVIAAGSIVSGIIPPDVIAAGQPAKVIRQL